MSRTKFVWNNKKGGLTEVVIPEPPPQELKTVETFFDREKQLVEKQAELADKPKYDYYPQQARIMVEVIDEKISETIVVAGTKKRPFVLARILALGPLVGYDDLIISNRDEPLTLAKRVKLFDYEVGELVLIVNEQLTQYESVVEGKIVTFLKDERFIIAKVREHGAPAPLNVPLPETVVGLETGDAALIEDYRREKAAHGEKSAV